MEKGRKRFIIAVFAHSLLLKNALAAFFSGRDNLAIVDLTGMEDTLAEKFIASFAIDIALLNYAPDGLVSLIADTDLARPTGAVTHFVLCYDDDNARKMYDLGESLLSRRIPLTQFRLDDEDDDTHIILAQTLEGIIRGRERLAER